MALYLPPQFDAVFYEDHEDGTRIALVAGVMRPESGGDFTRFLEVRVPTLPANELVRIVAVVSCREAGLSAHADLRFEATGDIEFQPSPGDGVWLTAVKLRRVEPGDLQVLVHAQMRQEDDLMRQFYSCALYVSQSVAPTATVPKGKRPKPRS